jgi:hypothetical protein
MNKVTLSIATIALVGLYAGTASAQCDFNIVPAKGVKGSFVRNFAACPSTEHGTSIPNAETEGDTDACQPVAPNEDDGVASQYSFVETPGDEGGCTIQTQAKLVKACEKVKDSNGADLNLDPGPCHITYVKGKCWGIQNSSNVLIGESDAGWGFATLSRASLNDETGGDMTVIDFPVVFDFGIPKDGGMKIKANSAEALDGLVGPANAELPECTSIEIVDVTIKDPQTLPFAKLGGATIPEAP